MADIAVVKRRTGRDLEAFKTEKLFESIYRVCLSVHTPEGEAQQIATHVTNAVLAWGQTKAEITSHDIRRVASRWLENLHAEAGYLYSQHQRVF